jgi:hypothetical protein
VASLSPPAHSCHASTAGMRAIGAVIVAASHAWRRTV